MTKAEAIDRLKGLMNNNYPEQEEALEMAIKALEHDSISKKKVIKSIKEQYIEHQELIPYWLSIGDLQ